jgi:hypothetical protein
MTASSPETQEQKPEHRFVDTASKVIAIIYAILIIPMAILAIIGIHTVNELGSLFNSWAVYWLCVGNFPITLLFTALIMWALRQRKHYSAALAVALIPVVVLIVSFFFGFL